MLSLALPSIGAAPLKILCLGSHSDDIEIGCGGTILQLLSRDRKLDVVWVVFSSDKNREREARNSAELFLDKAKRKEIIVKKFRDGFFPFDGPKIKEFFEGLKRVSPDLILTHNRKDAHQDHRLIAELTWNTFRDHWILEYEIPKYDGDVGQPSVFVPLESDVCQKKGEYLMEAFQSQHNKRWFEKETFLSLMRLRGMECNSPSGYAEAFYCRKLTI
ncbi:MAG TPA: PIG-L deacetylase family protein [Candidatus Sulfotelmatobacter sp.]|nr:PIG-L deacetylase family protein [Candidatus Sulfotelmatobacter sp.]